MTEEGVNDVLPKALIYGSDPTDEQLEMIKKVKIALKDTEEYQKNKEEADAYLTEVVMHRFLFSREYDFKKSLNRLKRHLKWRFEVSRPFEVFSGDVKAFNAKGCTQVNSRGPDKFGRPIYIMQRSHMQNVRTDKLNYEEDIKLLTYAMELTTKYFSPDVRRMVVVLNLEDFSLFNRPPKELTKQTISLFDEHFPETLGLAILYGSPWVFSKFFDAVKYFVAERTRKKILFVPTKVKEGSKLDKKLCSWVGDNWKELIGVGLDRPKGGGAAGYKHEEYFAKIEEMEAEEEKNFKS